MDREFEFYASPKSSVCVKCTVCGVWIGWRWGTGDEGVCVYLCVSLQKKKSDFSASALLKRLILKSKYIFRLGYLSSDRSRQRLTPTWGRGITSI
jgi:hypothetical protein